MKNIQKNAYEFIDIHEFSNQSLLNELIKKDNISLNFFENLKSEGHQYIINAKGDVNICNKKLEIIPVQFYHVNGYFYCSSNQLESLSGCPQIIQDSFHCSNHQISTLKYFPQIVNERVILANNKKL